MVRWDQLCAAILWRNGRVGFSFLVYTISKNATKGLPVDQQEKSDRVSKALDSFRIEIPSWGFANTGTRFGKFMQVAAANSIEEKFADAAEIHQLTGVTPDLGVACRMGSSRGRCKCAAHSGAGKEVPDLRWFH